MVRGLVHWIGGSSVLGLVLVWILLGCGEKSSTTSTFMEDGRIFVENQTSGGVFYTLLDHDSEAVITEGNLEANTAREITTDPIKGGTRITLRLVARIGTTNSAELDLTIDGNVTVRVPNTGTWGSGHLPTEIIG